MKKTLFIVIVLLCSMVLINSCAKENLDTQSLKVLDMNTISENFNDYETALLSGNSVIIKAGEDEIEISNL